MKVLYWLLGAGVVVYVLYSLSLGGSSSDGGQQADLEFKGLPCTVDCSGHEAGYDWASEKGITDPDDCGGNSNSFIEGCRSYAEEN